MAHPPITTAHCTGLVQHNAVCSHLYFWAAYALGCLTIISLHDYGSQSSFNKRWNLIYFLASNYRYVCIFRSLTMVVVGSP